MLKLENLSVKLGRKSSPLFSINSVHEPGTLTWIRGTSGSCKSTLLRVISGLQKPTSGTVNIFGHDLWSSSSRNRDKFRAKSMGIVFQDSGVVPCLTVAENLSFAQGLSGVTADSDANSSLLAQLNMSEYGASLPHELSGGQRQRAAIATAMSKKPQLVFADEPTSALDEDNAYSVLRYLHNYIVRNHAIALVVSHDDRLAQFCDQVLEIGVNQ